MDRIASFHALSYYCTGNGIIGHKCMYLEIHCTNLNSEIQKLRKPSPKIYRRRFFTLTYTQVAKSTKYAPAFYHNLESIAPPNRKY